MSAHERNSTSAGQHRATYGIVTALPKEYEAMRAMIDAATERVERGRVYVVGDLPAKGAGRHRVAIALADQGTASAAHRATLLSEDFPQIRAIVMVGIAGGTPHPTKAEKHVRLGDIVASGEGGIVAYDFVKEHTNHIEPRHPPRPPDASLLQSCRRLSAAALRGHYPWRAFFSRASHLPRSTRPPPEADIVGDTKDPTIIVPHPADLDREGGESRVFIGTIACANRLLKNPALRDKIRDDFDVRAVEMEGFGIAEATWNQAIGYLVVRGICDYCDSSKGNDWQAYAAIAAAAYVRAVLEETPSVSEERANHVAREVPTASELVPIDDTACAGGTDEGCSVGHAVDSRGRTPDTRSVIGREHTSLRPAANNVLESLGAEHPLPLHAEMLPHEAVYRRTVRQRYARISVPASALGGAVDKVFFWPRLRPEQDPARRRATDEDERYHYESEAVSLREFPATHDRSVVVIAGAGFGKTTLLEALAWTRAESWFVPAFVSLSALADSGHSVLEYLEAEFNAEYSVTLSWKRLCEEGRALLLFDGFDELPEARRPKVLREVKTIASRYPDVRWLLTVRDGRALVPPASAAVYEIEPLRSEDLKTFCAHYVPGLGGEAAAQSVATHVEASTELQLLAGIPLFVALLLARYLEQPEKPLPRRRADLLEEYVEMLLRPGLRKPDIKLSFPVEKLRRAAAWVAYAALSAARSTCRRARLVGPWQ